jgi:hypothetical protein
LADFIVLRSWFFFRQEIARFLTNPPRESAERRRFPASALWKYLA